jgi:hypothetical protein
MYQQRNPSDASNGLRPQAGRTRKSRSVEPHARAASALWLRPTRLRRMTLLRKA